MVPIMTIVGKFPAQFVLSHLCVLSTTSLDFDYGGSSSTFI